MFLNVIEIGSKVFDGLLGFYSFMSEPEFLQSCVCLGMGNAGILGNNHYKSSIPFVSVMVKWHILEQQVIIMKCFDWDYIFIF